MDYYMIGSAVVLVSATAFFLFPRKKGPALKKTYKQGVVILHQFPPTYHTPNISPFCLKLETYLRITKIPYVIESGFTFSSEGKLPWIELDGKEYCDSHFIILELEKRFNLNTNFHVGEFSMSVGVAVERMLEEHFYFAGLQILWVQQFQQMLKYNYWTPPIIMPLFAYFLRYMTQKSLYGQGMGRHQDEKVILLAQEDVDAVAKILGSNTFILGDLPSTFDASIFGALSSILTLPFDSPLKDSISKHPNLVNYIHRMTETYWSDWKQITSTLPRPSFVK